MPRRLQNGLKDSISINLITPSRAGRTTLTEEPPSSFKRTSGAPSFGLEPDVEARGCRRQLVGACGQGRFRKKS